MSELSAEDLSNIDFIVAVDRSGSTGNPGRFPGKTRFEEQAEDVTRIARQAEKYDSDGLTLIVYGSAVVVRDGVKADAVANVFNEYAPGGSTNTAGVIGEVVKKAAASTKNTVALIFTDGGANDEGALISQLREAASSLGRPKLGIVFVRVGDDPTAAALMTRLDSGLGGDVPDIVATTTSEAAEEFSLAHLAWMAQNA